MNSEKIRREISRALGGGNFLNIPYVKEMNNTVLAEFGDETVTINNTSYTKRKEDVIFRGRNAVFMVTPHGTWRFEGTKGKYLLCEYPINACEDDIQKFLLGEINAAYTLYDVNRRNGLLLSVENANDHYKMRKSGDRNPQFQLTYNKTINFLSYVKNLIDPKGPLDQY